MNALDFGFAVGRNLKQAADGTAMVGGKVTSLTPTYAPETTRAQRVDAASSRDASAIFGAQDAYNTADTARMIRKTLNPVTAAAAVAGQVTGHPVLAGALNIGTGALNAAQPILDNNFQKARQHFESTVPHFRLGAHSHRPNVPPPVNVGSKSPYYQWNRQAAN